MELDQSSAEETLRVLLAETEKRRKSRAALFWSLGIGLGILVTLLITVWIVKGSRPDLAGFSSLIIFVGVAASFTATHRAALKTAAELEDPRLVGVLLEARATSEEKDINEATERGLLKSLPLLDDPDLLDAYQRHLLYRFLNQTKNKQLAGLMLGCIQRVGGPEAIPSLEAFREAKGKSGDPEWQRLADTALLALPDVRIRVARKLIETRVTTANEEAEAQRLRLH